MMCPLNANGVSFCPPSFIKRNFEKKCQTQITCPLNANDVTFKHKWLPYYEMILQKKPNEIHVASMPPYYLRGTVKAGAGLWRIDGRWQTAPIPL